MFSYETYLRMHLLFADIAEMTWIVRQIACFEKLFIESVVYALDTILFDSHHVKFVSAVCQAA
jgi:hypothetical protein